MQILALEKGYILHFFCKTLWNSYIFSVRLQRLFCYWTALSAMARSVVPPCRFASCYNAAIIQE